LGFYLLRILKRILAIFLIGAVALAVLVYAGDYALFRYHTATNHNPYGSVVVTHYYAVLQKNGKTAFTFDPPGPLTCVNALFPHAGFAPCWYLLRHPEQRTDI
jgi:hypothetical protein